MSLKSSELSGKYGSFPTPEINEAGYSEILYTIKDLGLGEDFARLPESQRQRVLGIIYKLTFDPVHRDLLEAGINTYVRSELCNADECIYFGIRGSTSRGEADHNDDVDILIFGNLDGKGKLIDQTRLEEGRRLKGKGFKRNENGIVTYHKIQASDKWNIFLGNPVYLDTDEIDPCSKLKLPRIVNYQRAVGNKVHYSRILENLEADPFKFLNDTIKPSSKHFFRLDVDERAHNLIYTAGRLCGIQLKGNAPQHNVTKFRDAYIKRVMSDVLQVQL